MQLKRLIFKLVKFALVGLTATFVYAGLSYILIWVVLLNEVIANIIAYILAIPVSFFGQKYITFKSKGRSKRQAFQFVALQLFCLLVTTIIVAISNNVMHLHPNIGILLACVTVPIISYGAMSIIIFSEKAQLNKVETADN